MPPTDPNKPIPVEERLSKLEQAVASINGKIVGSWAMYTRDEYEKEFKADVKERLIGFATMFLATAVIFVAGAGYVILQTVVKKEFDDRNKQAIDTLQTRLEANYQQQVSWQTFHDTGVGRRQLAEFYYHLTVEDDETEKADEKEKTEEERKEIEKRKEKGRKQIIFLWGKAKQSFNDATKINENKATSYWELGALNYSRPKDFRFNDQIDRDQARYYYELALKHYTDFERQQGWVAQCYYDVGRVYLDLARDPAKADQHEKNSRAARRNLENALQEYELCKRCNTTDDLNNKTDIPILLDKISRGVAN